MPDGDNQLKTVVDIDPNEFPSNSNKSKEEKKEKDIQQVTTTGKVKKKSFGRKLKDALFGEDVGSVSQYIFYDVLIPASKKLISDMISGAVNMALFGETRSRRRDDDRTYVSYASYYDDRRREPARSRYRNRGGNGYSDMLFDDRKEADLVLERLCDLVDEYGCASVADLYSLTGFDSASTDHKWGWTNLRGAAVELSSGGYILNLPPAKPLD